MNLEMANCLEKGTSAEQHIPKALRRSYKEDFILYAKK